MGSNDYESIVTRREEPTLVLAGPGAGKTHLLGDRVKRLLDEGISNNSINVLTFGRDASQHMRNKLLDPEEGFGVPYDNLPNISTLNSLGLEIVNRKPKAVGLKKTGLQVQPDENIKRLLYRDAALIIGCTEDDAKAAILCKEQGKCERGSKDPECSICEKYWEIMSKCNRLDFDDQVIFACHILENDPELLHEYQEKSQHLLVDEYQDINAAQFVLIELLSRNSREGLFVVGDDAQSIYGFRGADPGYILRFEEDFPDAETPPLASSRRCHETIMQEAELILKTFYPEWSGPHELKYHVPPGEPPILLHVPSDSAEAEWVARIARDATTEKSTVLILVPKKEFFPRISQALNRYGVPHEAPANLLPDSVNNRLEVLHGLLKWVEDPEDNFLTRSAIESLINFGTAKVPGANKNRRYKPETEERRLEIENEIANLWNDINAKNSFLAVIQNHLTASDQIKLIRDILNELRESFENTKGELFGEFSKRLSLASGGWVNPTSLMKDFSSIMTLLNASQSTGFGSVQLMTMRKAKGLEADVVVIVGLEDDLMPNPFSDVDEEARLFYVSMTRAKQKLYLMHSFMRLRNISFGPEVTKKSRSRFLDTLGRESKYLRGRAKTS